MGLKTQWGSYSAANRLPHPVAVRPQLPGDMVADCNQNASEMLWRPAECQAMYFADRGRVHIRFTKPLYPVAEWCVRKTTAFSITDR